MTNNKGKWKRTTIGSILKSKDENKPNYLKLNLYKQDSITLEHGQTLQVVSKNYRLKEVERLRREEKLSTDVLDQMEAKANAMPDFVMADVVLVERE